MFVGQVLLLDIFVGGHIFWQLQWWGKEFPFTFLRM